jgi:3-hydroxypropionyl-CoA synthetase (ADP-forming)
MNEESKKKFHEHYPSTYVIGNPLDVTGSANADDYKFAIQTFLDDPEVDIIMPWFVFQDDPLEETIVNILGDFQKQKKKPILIGALGGPFTQQISKRIEENNVPVYHSVISWVTAAGSLAQWAKITNNNS